MVLQKDFDIAIDLLKTIFEEQGDYYENLN
jgi:hypothetical protein